MRKRRPTSTSAFGVGRRESHDATDFYARFSAPDLSDDHEVRATPPGRLDRVYAHDARDMPELEDASVALVVTSPPYFAGKEYEEALGEGHVPASYLDYLEMLRDVFATCVDKLEPGGRIAVNVANLGRKPYRSLSADVIGILQDDLGLLLRGEILWWKARGAAGSCAWGSFRSPANPVLRDLTERVVVASKGRFDRALAGPERARNRLPSEATISKDEFMEATTDVWEIPAESATRVGHPAPFPVELPQRLVELYTYRGDVVLDPFMGSGSTAVAALRTGRRFVGYDTDPGYVDAAMRRVEAERARLDTAVEAGARAGREGEGRDEGEGEADRALAGGAKLVDVAAALLRDCGFTEVQPHRRGRRFPVELALTARDRAGTLWYVDVCGGLTTPRTGLRRADVLWRALGRAGVLRAELGKLPPLLVLTTDLPDRRSTGWAALRAARGELLCDALDVRSAAARARLREYAGGSSAGEPVGDLVAPRDDAG